MRPSFGHPVKSVNYSVYGWPWLACNDCNRHVYVAASRGLVDEWEHHPDPKEN